ncbi:hypothetical protein G3O06_20600 [Burkholderia sp. Ac-20345]|uniref:hypothetical protein n=1 Tax=Burkholderia sp. Ac-20345 TaxID=2703891 RepID=UPI00197C26DC|nr:hypothetical protein [Burkholderia sp. Ac-20345]MBN3779940.1 hypothetical protein [Burkholderia sp. Ac-20345]
MTSQTETIRVEAAPNATADELQKQLHRANESILSYSAQCAHQLDIIERVYGFVGAVLMLHLRDDRASLEGCLDQYLESRPTLRAQLLSMIESGFTGKPH